MQLSGVDGVTESGVLVVAQWFDRIYLAVVITVSVLVFVLVVVAMGIRGMLVVDTAAMAAAGMFATIGAVLHGFTECNKVGAASLVCVDAAGDAGSWRREGKVRFAEASHCPLLGERS